MSELITVKNRYLTAVISTRGAELQSLKDADGKEYIWQGNPDVWSGRAPILFPICGGLKNDAYTLKGKKYTLEKHGFAKKSEFEVINADSDEAVFILRETPKTLASYPFCFEFRVKFKLDGQSLAVEFNVTNLSDSTMYFSCGAHEGFYLPCGIDGTKIVFDEKEELKNYRVTEGLLDTVFEPLGDGTDTLTLKKEYFAVDAIVLKELNSKGVVLKSVDGTRKVRVDFPDFEHLLIWQVCGAPYVCIEPWSGLPDIYGQKSCAIEEKESVTALSPFSSKSYAHRITVT